MKTMTFTVLALLVTSPALAGFDATQLVASARSQVGVTTQYDGAYRKLTYPEGTANQQVQPVAGKPGSG